MLVLFRLDLQCTLSFGSSFLVMAPLLTIIIRYDIVRYYSGGGVHRIIDLPIIYDEVEGCVVADRFRCNLEVA